MSYSQSFDMSDDEIYQFIEEHSTISETCITFAADTADREKEAISIEYEAIVDEMRKVMSDLISDNNGCVTRAVEFAYTPYWPHLEHIRKQRAQSEDG